jgi:Ca2+-binding RTX toxin-like protein
MATTSLPELSSLPGQLISGTEGPDTLNGGNFSTYLFGRGSGVETLLEGEGDLRVAEGITADDLIVRAVVPAYAQVDLPPNVKISYWFELHLSIKGSGDEFVVPYQWWSDDGQSQGLTGVVFADGTRWDRADLKARAWAGTAGNDVIQGFAGLDNVLSGEAGQDRLMGGEKQDMLIGGDGADSLYGREGNDTLQGGSGDDWLDGGLGSNVLVGGAGSDVYLFERDLAGSSVVDATPVGNEASSELETIRMGSGIRRSDIKLARQGDDLIVESRYAVGVGAQVERMLVRGNFGLDADAQAYSLIDRIEFVGDGTVWDAAEILRRTQNVYGLTTEGDDELNGDNLNNTLAGFGGQDSLVGYGGKDLLSGGQGADWLEGGSGQDTLDGGLGADTMVGGPDNDLFFVDSIGDQVVELPGRDFMPGVDTVATNLADYTLPTGVENLVMGGKAGDSPDLRTLISGKAGVRHGVGNADANVMTGDLGSEYFEGLGGNDLLKGGAGDDTLAGGMGDDSLEGGDGNDTYILRAKDEGLDPFGNVKIDGIRELSAVGSGIDMVDTDYDSFIAPPNVEQVFTTGHSVTGNGLNNLLRGGTGYTDLYGADGDDTLEGGGGGDVYVGGKGNDLLIASKPGSNDIFDWGLGDGADTLRDAGGYDHLFISGNVQASQLWFTREGDALKVSIIGTADSFTVEGWYQGAEHQIEDIQSLNVAKVQQLVDAMASFSPPPQGQTSLPADVAAQLAPVMAAVWG